jgi:ABC-type phosphate transport system substrate-binding protein
VRDRGSMLVLVTLVGVAMTAAVTLALVPVLTGLIDRQHAQSAADAAALAGVIGGRGASSVVAAANEATVVAWSRDGAEVTVTVAVGDQRATARATDAP